MADVFAHATWLYAAQAPTGRLFLAGEPVPASGWYDAPAKVPNATAGDKDAELAALRAEVAKMDPDGDGKIGGAVANPEKDALISELEAIPGARFDRRWGVAKLKAALAEARA